MLDDLPVRAWVGRRRCQGCGLPADVVIYDDPGLTFAPAWHRGCFYLAEALSEFWRRWRRWW